MGINDEFLGTYRERMAWLGYGNWCVHLNSRPKTEQILDVECPKCHFAPSGARLRATAGIRCDICLLVIALEAWPCGKK